MASLGTIIDCQGLSEALEDFGGMSTLTFSEFEQYLSREVFSSLSDSLGRKELSSLEGQIDEACWIISKSKLLSESLKRSPRVDSENIFKLFRIFCLLADLVRDAETDIAQVKISQALHLFTSIWNTYNEEVNWLLWSGKVLLCSEEADLVFTKFLSSLSKEWDMKEEFDVSETCLLNTFVIELHEWSN